MCSNVYTYIFYFLVQLQESKTNFVLTPKQYHQDILYPSLNIQVRVKYIYFICRLGGPYGEKL